MSKLSPGEALLHTKVGQLAENDKAKTALGYSNRFGNPLTDPDERNRSVHDVNIFLPNENDNGVVGCQTPARRYEPLIVAGNTPWGVLQDIAEDHPGIALAVRPYDGRATLFMGNPELDYIQSSRALWGVNLANLGQSDSRAANPRPFRRYHLARSGWNLIRNSLEITKEFFNEVAVNWAPSDAGMLNLSYGIHITTTQPMQTGVNAFTGNISDTAWGEHTSNPGDVPARICLDTGIEPSERRALQVSKRNATNKSRALRMAMSILGNNVGRVYKGSIWMRSDVDIWPWDVVLIYDEANQMFGPIEVDEVVLHFDRELGYVYEIKPNALVAMQNYVTRDILHSTRLYSSPDGHIDTTPPKGYKEGATQGIPGGDAGHWYDGPWRLIRHPIDTIVGQSVRDWGNTLHGGNGWDYRLGQEARGEIEAYPEDTYNAIANHPISVFPLMYQGRPWWPLSHRGSLIDTMTEQSATPDAGAGADSRKVKIFGGPVSVFRTFRGAYNDAIEDYKESHRRPG